MGKSPCQCYLEKTKEKYLKEDQEQNLERRDLVIKEAGLPVRQAGLTEADMVDAVVGLVDNVT